MVVNGNPKGYRVIRSITYAYVGLNIVGMFVRKVTTGWATVPDAVRSERQKPRRKLGDM